MSKKTTALNHLLRFINPYLDDENVEELQINGASTIWVQRAGQPMESHEGDFDLNDLAMIAQLIASFNNQKLSREAPLLSGMLPGGQRIQIVTPPACKEGQIIFAIRRYRLLDTSLDKLAALGLFEIVGQRAIETLKAAVKNRKNIVISGGTFSGKTTLANALIKEIPDDEALVTIEDSAELNPPQGNVKSLLYSRSSGVSRHTARNLFEAALRLRPDRVLAGELRGEEALMWLELINSDHPGSITTVHASSPDRVFDRIALMALTAGIKLEWADILTYTKNLIDVVIQIKRENGNRRISEIVLNYDD